MTAVIPQEIIDLDLEAWYLGEVEKPCQFSFWGTTPCPQQANWLLYPDKAEHERLGCVDPITPLAPQFACDYHMCAGRDGDMRHGGHGCDVKVPLRLIERIK